MVKRYVMQDGGQFYEPDPSRRDSNSAELVITTYPWHVGDFDLDAAMQARDWFLLGQPADANITFS